MQGDSCGEAGCCCYSCAGDKCVIEMVGRVEGCVAVVKSSEQPARAGQQE